MARRVRTGERLWPTRERSNRSTGSRRPSLPPPDLLVTNREFLKMVARGEIEGLGLGVRDSTTIMAGPHAWPFYTASVIRWRAVMARKRAPWRTRPPALLFTRQARSMQAMTSRLTLR